VDLAGPSPAGGAPVSAHRPAADHGVGQNTIVGIPKERQKEIFSAFTQADNFTTRGYGGIGLGLTISHRLTEMLGGRMWVESDVGRAARSTSRRGSEWPWKRGPHYCR
jgi:light-regulated signal transduction histidine kinase (bacteriophytochrome)